MSGKGPSAKKTLPSCLPQVEKLKAFAYKKQ